MDVVLVAGDRADGRQQVAAGGSLHDVARRAGEERLAHRLLVVVHRHRDDPHGGCRARRSRTSATPSEPSSERSTSMMSGAQLRARASALTGSLASPRPRVGLGLEDQLEALADEGVVVDDPDADHRPRPLIVRGRAAARG